MEKKMKKSVVAILVILSSVLLAICRAKPMTTGEIIAKCAEAMGGIEKIKVVKTLRFKSVYPDHGYHPLVFEMKRPNLSMNPAVNLVFDGQRACFLKGQDNESASELVNEEEWKDFEVEIAFKFPAFFDYPVEYAGEERFNEKTHYKLAVALPLGAKMNYFIDQESFLIAKITTDFVLYGEERHAEQECSDYREVDGVLFPYGFTYGSRTGQMKGWIHSIEINFPISDGYFDIPDDMD